MRENRTRPSAPAQDSLRQALDALRGYVEYQQSTAVEGFPRSELPTTLAPESVPARTVAPPPERPVVPGPPLEPAVAPVVTRRAVGAGPADLFVGPEVRQAQSLEELRTTIGDCHRCKLCNGRTHIVFGVGNPHAALMFVGEGPGRDEDLQGEPFVGRAGQLLTEIITKGMKMRREDVYIANVIKCRPPQNRNPEADEIAACQPFLQRQVELVQPQVIIALGTFAAQTLLGLKTPISRLRGQWYDYQRIKLMPTLHPAYLLRNPNDKRLVWEDIKLVLRELGQRP